jgi:hypothetical protein
MEFAPTQKDDWDLNTLEIYRKALVNAPGNPCEATAKVKLFK